jgi:hypothetical protein
MLASCQPESLYLCVHKVMASLISAIFSVLCETSSTSNNFHVQQSSVGLYSLFPVTAVICAM